MTLPKKSDRPRPNSRTWDRHKRYFDVGDRIEWKSPNDGELKAGVISGIKVNKFGRVSYYCGGELIFLEEIREALRRKTNPRRRGGYWL